ncbi:MAG: anthranilate phosphoribosyltransferase [Candidatus Peregrinibacteria bacterium]
MSFLSALTAITAGRNLPETQSAEAFRDIFAEQVSSEDLEIFLRGLSQKGETDEEIAGAAKEMEKVATKISTHQTKIFDSCGTGGSGSAKTFNVSTTAAFVLAGGGVTVAKHGNRAASSKSGSADVLECLGISLENTPEETGKILESVGIAFLFAQKIHPAMRFIMPVRKKIEHRTIFNILGPLVNPAHPTHQVVGVFSQDLVLPIAKALQSLGRVSALVVHGNDGLDEITVCDSTTFALFQNGGEIQTGIFTPEDFGISRVKHEEVQGGTPPENAQILEGILRGEIRGAKRDIVLLNAGAGFWISGKAESFLEGMALAKKVIDTGKVWGKVEELRNIKV